MIARTLVAVLLLVAGCAAGPQPAEPEVPEASVQARALRVPFDEYKYSRTELQTIEHAEDLLTRDCMRGLGMDWELLPPPASEDPDPFNRRRYGLIEPAIAARFGYHVPPPPPELAAREAVWAERDRLPLAERRAALGADGQGGCAEQSILRLREGVPDFDDYSRVNDYSASAFDAAQKTPDVVRVFEEWSACMATAGFQYPTPFTAFDDPEWARSSRPSSREIAVAETDVRCKEENRVVEVWSAAEERVQRDIINHNSRDFADFHRTKTTYLAAAARTIRELGTE
jgi:hypothetical protein